MMKIHKEGYTIITLAIIILIIINIIVEITTRAIPWISFILTFVSFVFLLLIIWFFRDPSRNLLPDELIVTAPADGKVVVIEENSENEYFKDQRIQVSIFMSPLNVHVNRYPISGKVVYYKYHPGDYLVAWHPKSSTHNERTTIVVKNAETGIEVLLRQIAGAVARRIVCYSEVDKNVTQGEQLGFIKFGSRVDLYLPLNAKINVELNQKVLGNKTIIAHLN
jgi:phosphatidylserine decarboxylase